MEDDDFIDNAEDFLFAIRVLRKNFSSDEIICGTKAKDSFGDWTSAMEYSRLAMFNINQSSIAEPHWNREVVRKVYEMLEKAYLKDKTNDDLRLIYNRQFRKDLGL